MSGVPPPADAQALLASLAHELRGPLNVCMMWLELLELKASQPEDVHKAAAVMRRNLVQQASLIRELDDLGRMVGGGVELEVEEVDLAALLRRALDGWRTAAAERGVELLERLPEGALLMDGDRERLLQACGYWFDNALAATPSGGRIQVALAGTNGAAELVITDSGTGLTAAEAARFFASPLEGPRRHKALGLRWVLGKHLIERHGGTVDVASEGVDAGCTWTARFVLKH